MPPVSRRFYEVIDPPIKVAGEVASLVEVDQVIETDRKGKVKVLQQRLTVLWGVTKEQQLARLAEERAALDDDVLAAKQAIDDKVALIESAAKAEVVDAIEVKV